jgi:O-antigen ligase
MLLIGWIFVLLFHHGLTRGFGGGIGGINRNVTSSVGLAGMICCALSTKRTIRLGAIGCCALFAVMVTSRGTIVALGSFLAVYYVLQKGTIRAVLHAVLGIVLVTSVLLASSFLKQFILEDVMRLHDKSRGLGSGFTGRSESWRQGIKIFWESPLVGHGFRAQLAGQYSAGQKQYFAHGGYVTLLIETGVIGTILAVAAVVAEAIRRMRRAFELRNSPANALPGVDLEESLRLNAVACATMAAMLTYWVYEPVYLNLGTVMSIVFFLMFGAPEFVVNRRATLRS